ncbi:MAG: transglutaminaseTgpA domain-containing protein, partial [Thermoguttaceae bacterium]
MPTWPVFSSRNDVCLAMELKNLLSVVIAALAALGAMLFAMGSQNPWLAMALWMAAILSLVLTDFLGVVRVPRNLASLLMWGVLLIFLPHFLMQRNWDNRLQTVASILICLQMTLLFQEKDPRVYGWLAVMSLLQAVVAARYSEGVVFGGLLIAYTIVGVFALSLLVLYSQWGRYRDAAEVRAKRTASAFVAPPGTTNRRWPLAIVKSSFTSAPAGTGRSGVVTELFARLALIGVGALLLAAIIFSTVPRFRLSAWRGEGRKTLATVGFNSQIMLGGLGETLESPEEVMQLKLVDPATGQVYPMRDDVYLRGSEVAWYSQNQWRRTPPPNSPEPDPQPLSENSLSDPFTANKSSDSAFQIGPPVVQQITMEPFLDRDDVFYIWPLIEPVGRKVYYVSASGRLLLVPPDFSREPRSSYFNCEVRTSGLVDGHQAPLVPANQAVRVSPYLQMPGDRSPLPRLTALAARWLREGGPPLHKHDQVARWFEQKLSSSGQFQYTLQGPERDTSIDAIEDFVSNNPRGHCEYFATALAMMLRSQGIPSRVVLGYRCDEYHKDEQYYQVRQLHAHAWVEAFLDPNQIPETLRRSEPNRWVNGGWLRLDPTPAGEVGTQAAERTMWGAWQGRWHSLQRSWDKYIVSMDRKKQRESVYEPISRATRSLTSKLFNPQWWKELAASLRASLAAMFQSGIMGWLFGVVILILIIVVPITVGWWLVRRLGRFWRQLSGSSRQRQAGAWSSIEFYRRFEQIVARFGLQRGAGQTPREFASAAGTRLAAASGRSELYARAVQ